MTGTPHIHQLVKRISSNTYSMFSKILVTDKIDIVKTAVIWAVNQGRTSATYLSDTKKSLKYYPA